MQLVNIMMIPKHKLLGLLFFVIPLISLAQENSPYSRYGIGNITPSGNILNRAMGGISAGYADGPTITSGGTKGQALGQAINFLNPATYSNFINTTFDIGTEVASRTIKSTNPVDKFTANNAIISYIQIGIPLLNGNKKALKKDVSWGLNFGLKPVSRISYKIQTFARTSIDT